MTLTIDRKTELQAKLDFAKPDLFAKLIEHLAEELGLSIEETNRRFNDYTAEYVARGFRDWRDVPLIPFYVEHQKFA